MRAYQNLEVTGSIDVTGSITANYMTAINFYGTASQAATSSFLSGSGDLVGSLSGSMTGSLTGSMSGTLEGFVSGTMIGIATGSFTGSFRGEYSGSGANLYDISASSIVGLNLSRIATGSLTASLAPNNGFLVNTRGAFSGSLNVSGTVSASKFSGSGADLFDISASAIVGLNLARISTSSVSASAYIDDGTGSFHITNDTYITGSLTAYSLFAESASITHLTTVYETSSYIYLTGSTKFGDEVGVDVHEFTGSVGVTGSLEVEGATILKDLQITGSVGISGSLLVSGTFTVVGTDGSSLQINVPSDPTTGSLFAILDTSNNYVLEVFANRVTTITGSLAVTGNLDVTSGITGSLTGSFEGEATGSFTGSFYGIFEGTSSQALTSSYSAQAALMDGGLY